jgi:HEAT repeat protein
MIRCLRSTYVAYCRQLFGIGLCSFLWLYPVGLAFAQAQSPGSSITPFISQLTDRNPRIRMDAADALVNLGTPAIPALIEALQQSDAELRWRAASVLSDLGPEAASALPVLVQTLQDSDPQVRLYATIALGNMGKSAQDAVPQLVAALQDKDAYVRIYAPTALRKIGVQGTVAISALAKALADQNPRVRLNAAYALGSVGAEAERTIVPLINTLDDPQIYVRLGAVKGLAGILGAFQDQEKSLSSGKLNRVIQTFEGVLTHLEQAGFTPDDIARIRRPLTALQAEQETRVFDRGLRFAKTHPWWGALALYLTLIPTFSLALLWIAPLWVLRLNEVLKPYTDFTVPLLGLNVPLRQVLMVGWFHYHPRVLDAWVNHHWQTVSAQFNQKATVRDRRYHIPLPAIWEGATAAEITTQTLRPTFQKQRTVLLIWGEGGSGKTSLACQIGQWAMAEDPAQRLCDHRMLPVLLEDPLRPVADGSPLLEAIRGQLQVVTDSPEAIGTELLTKLLRHRRILVILDRFSELPSDTRNAVQPETPNFPVNALIVTSRIAETLGRINHQTLKPLRLEGNRLASFMEAYLVRQGSRDRFTDTEFFAACQQLSRMVGARQITVLFAKLYADQLIRQREQPSTDLERFPNLMLEYLNALNRDITTDRLEDRILHQDAKSLAWACVQDQFSPVAIPRSRAIAALVALHRDQPEVHLDYLEQQLHLIQTVGAGKDQICFCLEPLAEYLAALEIVSMLGGQPHLWEKTLFKPIRAVLQQMPVEKVQGFLVAVQDCAMVSVRPLASGQQPTAIAQLPQEGKISTILKTLAQFLPSSA